MLNFRNGLDLLIHLGIFISLSKGNSSWEDLGMRADSFLLAQTYLGDSDIKFTCETSQVGYFLECQTRMTTVAVFSSELSSIFEKNEIKQAFPGYISKTV